MKMQMKALQDQLDAANEQITDLKGQRDKWQKQADQVLITSQYSQKQAEEFRNEVKEREKRAQERRQKMLDDKMKKMQANNENSVLQGAPTGEAQDDTVFQGLWKKVKGER
jgi:uncharacterized coiled-coil DUF342 family protein